MDKHDIVNFKIFDCLNVSKSSVLIDVGANMGIYTGLFLSKIDEYGKVFCIELDPDNCKILNDRFCSHKNITLLNYAISDKVGESISYYKHCFHNQMSRLSINPLDQDQYRLAGVIDTSTLDEILKNEIRIEVLKIDIEGAEEFAIFGMIETLKKTQVLFFENHCLESWVVAFPILSEDFICYNVETCKKIFSKEDVPYQTICIKKTNPDLIVRLETFFDGVLHNPMRQT